MAAIKKGPLELALAQRSAEAARQAISDGALVNEPFADGLTPLCRAAALGEKKILKLLVAANADLDAAPRRDPDKKISDVCAQVVDAGFAALHWSARENKMESAQLLVDAGATVDVRATDDVTPFMLACKSGHHDCAKLLHRAGADVEAANVRGGSAMVVACVMGEAETVRLLLSMRADPDAVTVALDDSDQPFQCRPLVTACRYDRPSCVKELLNAGVSAESMQIALTELEAFPSFVECARLVKQAAKRKAQATKRRGGDKAGQPKEVDADAVARAEAAMAALLAEESAKPKPTAANNSKPAKPAVQPPLANVNLLGGVRRSDTAEDNMSSASSANGDHDLAGFLLGQRKGGYGFVQQQPQGGAPSASGAPSGAAAKNRRGGGKKKKANKMAAELWVEEEALVDVEEAPVSPTEKGATSQEEREEEEEMEAALVAVAKATRAMRARPSEQQQSSVGHTPERRDSKEDMMEGTTRKSSPASSPAAASIHATRATKRSNMNSLVSEYQLYHGEVVNDGVDGDNDGDDSMNDHRHHHLDRSGAQGGAPSPTFEVGLHAGESIDDGQEEEHEEEDDDDDDDGEGSSRCVSPTNVKRDRQVEVCEVTSDLLAAHLTTSQSAEEGLSEDLSSQQSDYEEVEKLIKSEKAEELDMFLHRKKFTTSAMNFFLTKIKEDGPPPTPSPGGDHNSSNPMTTQGKPKLKFANRTGQSTTSRGWTIAGTAPLDEEERRRRKARRSAPPPGFLPTSQYEALERRLEEELTAAKEREEALQAALRQLQEGQQKGAVQEWSE